MLGFSDLLHGLGTAIANVHAVRAGISPDMIALRQKLIEQQLQEGGLKIASTQAAGQQDPAILSALHQHPEMAPTFGASLVPNTLASPETLAKAGYANEADRPAGRFDVPVLNPRADTTENLQRQQLQLGNLYQQKFNEMLGVPTPGGIGGGNDLGYTLGGGGQSKSNQIPEVDTSAPASTVIPRKVGPVDQSGESPRLIGGGGASGGLGPFVPTLGPRGATLTPYETKSMPYGTMVPGPDGKPIPLHEPTYVGKNLVVPAPPKPIAAEVKRGAQTQSVLDAVNELDQQLQSGDPKMQAAIATLGPHQSVTIPESVGGMSIPLVGGQTVGRENFNKFYNNYLKHGGKGNTPEQQALMHRFGYLQGTSYQPLLAGGRGSEQVIDDIKQHLPAAWKTAAENRQEIAYLRQQYGDQLAHIPLGSGGAADVTQVPGTATDKGVRKVTPKGSTTSDLEQSLIQQYQTPAQ